MARAPATNDVYTAIAEPKRRLILEFLGGGERAVGEVVGELDIGQPTVSEHLRILREVDLVNVRKDGRRRLYSVNAEALRPVQTWVEQFERFWTHQIDRIQARAEAKRRESRHEEGT